jgi:hypothetical protein
MPEECLRPDRMGFRGGARPRPHRQSEPNQLLLYVVALT